MKKLISIIAALSMIASLGVTSFAAIDASVSDAATGTTLSYSEGTFTAGITGNASQNTIVVVKGDGSDISTTSIEYINQDAASQNFNFVLKNTPDSVDDFKADPADENETVASGATLTYTVLMGGDTVSKTEVGTITYTYTKDVVNYTVTFYDEDGETVLGTGSYEENTAVTIPADPTKAEDENNTYAFAGWKVKGAEDSTAVKLTELTATADAEYVAVYTATPKVPEGGEETGDIVIENGTNAVVAETTVGATVSSVMGKVYSVTIDTTANPTLTGKIPVAYNGDGTEVGTTYYSTERSKYIVVVPAANATDTITLKAVDGTVSDTNTISMYGNLNTDTFINANDNSVLNLFVKKPNVSPIRTNVKLLLTADINGDGNVNANDKAALTLYVKKNLKNGFAILKK